MGREEDFRDREIRFFKIPDKRVSVARLQREFDVAKDRFPVVYGDEQFAKPGTLPDPFAWQYAFDMVRTRNPNLVEPTMFVGAWEIEREAISMIADLFNHPNYEQEDYNPAKNPVLGWFTDSGTSSMLQAFWAFRNKHFRDLEEISNPKFNRVEEQGVFRRDGLIGMVEKGLIDLSNPPVILAPIDMHFAGDKSIDMLGLGSRNIIRYGLTKDFSSTDYTRLEEIVRGLLKEKREIMFAVASGGAVDSGRVEDVEEFAATLRKAGCEVPIIVDAAQQYMMMSLLSELYPKWDFKVDDVKAIVADPHKTDASPYPGSLVLFKDIDLVHETKNATGYLHLDDKVKYDMKELWQLMPSFHTSRSPIGAIATWAHLISHGKERLKEKYQENYDLTMEIDEHIKESPYFKIVKPTQTGIIAFHVKDLDDDKAREVYKAFETNRQIPRFYISFSDGIRLRTPEDHLEYERMKSGRIGQKINGFGGLYIQVMQHSTPELVEEFIERLDRIGRQVVR